MGFLEDLGLGEILASVNEMRDELAGLRDDVVSTITDSSSDLTSTVDDIAAGISGDDTSDNE
jgi:hypothetical protein